MTTRVGAAVTRVGATVLLLLGWAAHAPAQTQGESPSGRMLEVAVAAGAVATALVAIPAPLGVASATYRLVAADGVRLFGPSSGSLEWDAEPDLVLPVTFAVPRSAPAGARPAVEIFVDWPASSWRGGVVAVVAARHAVEAQFAVAAATVPRGGERELSVRLDNRGNVTDTIVPMLLLPPRWQLLDSIAPVALAAGEAASLVLRVRAPADAPVGASQVIALAAQADMPPTTVTLRVADARADEDGWVSLPGTMFVGASDLAGGRTATSLDAGLALAGVVLPETHLSLSWRHLGSAWTGTALRRELTGPALRAELRRPRVELAAGDVHAPATALAGGYVQGVGTSGAVELGSVRAEWLAGRPGFSGSGVLPGHLGWLRASAPIGAGRVHVTIADLDQPAAGLGDGRARSASTGYRFHPGSGHEVSAEIGATHADAAGGRADAGPAAQAQYRFLRDGVNVELRARSIAAVLPGSPAGSELFAAAGGPLSERVALSIWGLGNWSTARSGEELAFASSAVSLRYGTSRMQAHVTTSAAQNRGGAGLFSASDQLALTGGVFVPIGVLHLDVSGQLARMTTALGSGYATLTSGRIGWFDGGEWIALAAAHQTTMFGNATAQIDLAGARLVRGISLEGGAGIDLDVRPWTERTRGWIAASRAVSTAATLLIGVDYQPWRAGAEPLRFSAGVRHAITPPLPLRRQPVAHGILYEDVNANGRRDAGEPVLEGITVRRGTASVVTGTDGRYAFFETGRAAVEIGAASIDDGLVLPARDPIAAVGRADVGLVRTGQLTIELLIDSIAGPARPAPQHIRVTIVHESGQARAAESEADGFVRFAALLPGRYTLSVHPHPDAERSDDLQPHVVELSIVPGDERHLTLPVPFRTREVRFRSGAN